MNKYTRLYAWMWFCFRDQEFSIDSFRATFPISQAPKVIHDLVKLGYIKREKRGIYRVAEPEAFIGGLVRAEMERPDVLNEVYKKYAYTENNAVSIWTDGFYWTGFTRGFIPRHIKVRTRDVKSWQSFFRQKGLDFALEDENRSLFGQVYILHARKDFKVVEKEGIRVIPLEETVRFCLEHEPIYAPALEYLEGKYRIGYSKKEHTAVRR